ncbi:hypothetical protein IF2G_00941 [Cordyceps javanica]|nr:hypothetical protein IF2G_00941 [Cordyceps javanica]
MQADNRCSTRVARALVTQLREDEALLELPTFITVALVVRDKAQEQSPPKHHTGSQAPLKDEHRSLTRCAPDSRQRDTTSRPRDTTGIFTRNGPTEFDDARCPTVPARFNKIGGV